MDQQAREQAFMNALTTELFGLFTVEGVVAGWMVAGASVPG
jgi:hypothetical protein